MKLSFLIDPGHGGKFTGAVCGDAVEKDINLSVSLMLQRELSRRGAYAGLTRMADHSLKDDLNEDLQERCNIEHHIRPDLTISIHCNSFSNLAVNGFEIFTTPGETDSDEFATGIFESVKKAFPNKKYRIDMADNDPDQEANFKVLKGTIGPAVLIELGFLSNDFEREWLLDEHNQYEMAKAICSGVIEHFTLRCKECGNAYSDECKSCLA